MSEYKRIRVLVCDHLNLARGKYLSPAAALKNVTHLSIGTYALGYDRVMTPAPGTLMYDGLPDMDAIFDVSSTQRGWEQETGIVIADFYRNDKPLPMCGRSRLKQSIINWKNHGLEPVIGIEFEAFVFQRSENGGWEPYNTPGAFVYGTGSIVDPDRLMDLIWEHAHKCGFDLELINSEYDCSQFEFTLRHKNALLAVDEAFLFRVMARELLASKGYLLSFMPKPLTDRGGSGFHINFSFTNGAGDNVIADVSSSDGISKVGKQSIAGLLHHHAGLTCLVAPSVNSYRRIKPGNLAGYWANWGYDHRGVTVRIPDERESAARLEYRLPDCSSNPYVAVAATLEAARLGMLNDYKLLAAETGDCLEQSDSDQVAPETLGAALEALASDNILQTAMGVPFVEHLLAIKQKEWTDYLNHTTDWETERYFNFL